MIKSSTKRSASHVQKSPTARKVAAPAGRKATGLQKSSKARTVDPMRNPTAEAHKKIAPLLKKRERLQVQMAQLDDQIATALRNQTPGPIQIEKRSGPGQSGSAPLSSKKKAPAQSKSSLSPKAGSKHGMLKESILSSLQKAGRKGLTVGELSAQVGVLKANIQVWFSSTGRKVAGLEKVERGRWRYTGKR